MSESVDLELEDTGLEEPGADVINLAASVDPLLSQWARFRELFVEGLQGGDFWTIEDLEQRIAHRRAFFFPGDQAALIGQVEVYPGGARVFQTIWAVGDTAELVRMLPGVESVARMMGCSSVLLEGREAWKRILAGAGYEPWSCTVHKRL